VISIPKGEGIRLTLMEERQKRVGVEEDDDEEEEDDDN